MNEEIYCQDCGVCEVECADELCEFCTDERLRFDQEDWTEESDFFTVRDIYPAE